MLATIANLVTILVGVCGLITWFGWRRRAVEILTNSVYWRNLAVWGYLAGVIGFAIKQIYHFGSSDAAISRIEILWLLIHLFNLCIYGFYAIVLFIWQTRDEQKIQSES